MNARLHRLRQPPAKYRLVLIRGEVGSQQEAGLFRRCRVADYIPFAETCRQILSLPPFGKLE